MSLLKAIQSRVAKLDVTQQKSLVMWLNWQERRRAVEEQKALGVIGEKSAAAIWPRENWNELTKTSKKNGKRTKAR